MQNSIKHVFSTRHRDLLAKSASVANFDRRHVIHPYGMINIEEGQETFPEVVSAKGTKLTLQDGTELIDGVSSWWACAHGYRRKELDEAVTFQLTERMSHSMFGGLTHRPAAELIARLLDVVPQHEDEDRQLSKVFLCDSGSVSVEVAMKMALQYWESKQRAEGKAAEGKPRREKFLTTYSGYHGDTFLPMSVSDPINGMHHLFRGVLSEQVFVSAPRCAENDCTADQCNCKTAGELEEALKRDESIAAVIIEPIFQGAGAMRDFSPALLRRIRQICDKYEVPLILDEIATGFGRTGEFFAANHAAGVVPDIMCVGKALTGGYITMGATIVSRRIANGITTPLMHGPTFMANPLACSVACASIDLFLSSPWQERAKRVETLLKEGLEPLRKDYSSIIADIRVLGAIGVIEFKDTLTLESKKLMTNAVLANKVWLRPFANFLYTMPPFNAPLEDDEVRQICTAMRAAADVMLKYSNKPHNDSNKKAKVRSEDPETFV